MTYITILKDKSKFLLLHKFTKCVPGTIVNQIVIWFVKTSTKFVRCELRVVKSNSDHMAHISHLN